MILKSNKCFPPGVAREILSIVYEVWTTSEFHSCMRKLVKVTHSKIIKSLVGDI